MMRRVEISKLNFDYLILLLIVIVGSILRFYHFEDIPYTHDELSAICRLNYNSFSELIEKGVMVDGHPAVVHVFLFYWTKLFGFQEYIVKLPFILFGIGSIVLVFANAKKWFNSTTALLATAFIATLQFPIVYSQIARPYASGLFFSLLMVYFWSNFLFDPTKKRINTLLGFILSAVICSYNHYFSLLLVAIVGFTGIFYTNKQNYKSYLLALTAIGILFIPHLKIFLIQINSKGLEWLSKPTFMFPINHLQFIFHYSSLVYFLAIILLIYSAIKRRNIALNKFHIFSVAWFITPLIIGFTYSLLIKPVIQHSVLIFSFPFLLIGIFSFFNDESFRFKAIAVLLILLINTSTLIYSRQHYQIFYKQPFKEFATLTHDFAHFNTLNTTIVLNGNKDYIDFYFTKYNPDVEYLVFQNCFKSPIEFRNFLSTNNSTFLICGNIPLEYLGIIGEFFPFEYQKVKGFTYEYSIYSKTSMLDSPNTFSKKYYSSTLSFDNIAHNWSKIESTYKSDSTHNVICKVDSTNEWGPTFKIPLKEISPNRHVLINVSVEIKSEKNSGLIVCDISKNGKTISWKSSALKEYIDSTNKNGQKAYLAVRLTDIFKTYGELNGCLLTVYIWNNEKDNLFLDNFTITFQEGNNTIYALFEDID